MHSIISLFGVDLNARNVFINLGSVVSFAVFIIALFFYNSRSLKSAFKNYIVPILIVGITTMTIGQYAAYIVCGLSMYQGDSFFDTIRICLEKQAIHYIGMVLIYSLVFPALFIGIYKKDKAKGILDCIAFIIPIQHIFSRIGCILEGCCLGDAYYGPLSVKYPDDICTNSVYPTKAFEIICMIALLIVIIIRQKKGKNIFPFTLIAFSIVIFVSELFMNHMGEFKIIGISIKAIFALVAMVIAIVDYKVLKKGGNIDARKN